MYMYWFMLIGVKKTSIPNYSKILGIAHNYVQIKTNLQNPQFENKMIIKVYAPTTEYRYLLFSVQGFNISGSIYINYVPSICGLRS